jgi:glutaminyl-peptide cyclotransferase
MIDLSMRILPFLITPGLLFCFGRDGLSQNRVPRSVADARQAPQGKDPASKGRPGQDEHIAHVNAAQAMQYVKQVVAFGPRPVGSAAHAKLEEYLRAHLKADHLEEDSFTAATPAGQMPMRNFIAKFPGTKDGIVVVAGHYDTLYGRNDFVGANDGGSSTGLPLALADFYRARKKLPGYSVWIVLTDGEEAFQHWSASDSVYGARHLAAKWKQDGTAKKIKALLVLDMIGDADLNVDRDQYSTPWLEDLVYAAATRLGYQSHFFGRTLPIEDDHLPFRDVGIPVADLIDLNYGYNNVFWHTREDTLDKLSPQSLQIAGDTVLETIRLIDARH